MKLHIALVAPESIVPVDKYGGTERVLIWLDRGLRSLGHRVSLVVHPSSQVDHKVKNIPNDCDLVHFFSHRNDQFRDKPWIFTQHGNAQSGEKLPLNTVFISSDHARRHGGRVYVHNGIDPNDYVLAPKERRACFLGKARWKVKNVNGAIEVARAAGVDLDICGGWRLSFSKHVRWKGMVGQHTKVEILGRSSFLINPIRWHEPFGLAVVEAMLSGCFILATPYGSLTELILPETGALATSASKLGAMALESVPNPDRIRESAASRFDHVTMAKRYTELYEKVLQGQTLHASSERIQGAEDPEVLLPWQQ